MEDWQATRLTEAELKEFFDGLFPNGLSSPDVLAEIAPEGWENSPLLRCFHPSIEQVFHEQLQMHRNIENLVRTRREREPENPKLAPQTEPTLEEMRAGWNENPVNISEEVKELIALSLWDLFSDNHEVIASDGRVADIGSFRGAAAFLAQYLNGPNDDIWNMDYCQFYLGTIWISRRADLTPVYQMIFRRLKSRDADWVYHFPELGLVDMSPLRQQMQKPEDYSPSESFAAEQEEEEKEEELEGLRAELAEGNEQARRKALALPPPATVRAYQSVYGREPGGWPPI